MCRRKDQEIASLRTQISELPTVKYKLGAKHGFALIPTNNFVVVHKQKLKSEEEALNKGTKVISMFKPKRFLWNQSSRRYVTAAMAQMPAVSAFALEQGYPLLLMAFFKAAGLDVSSTSLVEIMPCRDSLQDIQRYGAADSLLLLQKEFKEARARYLGCDKGNRGGVDHFAKGVALYNTAMKKSDLYHLGYRWSWVVFGRRGGSNPLFACPEVGSRCS